MGGLARSRIWTVSAVLPLLASLASVSGPRWLVCPGDCVPRPECCCPYADRDLAVGQSTQAMVSAGCCCDTVGATAGIGMPAVGASREPTPATVKVVATPPVALSLAANFGLLRNAAGMAHSPPSAIPILLRKESFL